MDPNTLLSSSSGSAGSDNNDDAALYKKLWVFLLMLPAVCFVLYVLFTIMQEIGRIKFSIEPIVYTGLDSAAAVLPSFNVALHAESTHYGWAKFCSSGPVAMEVAYSGMTIPMADAEPFCVDARGEKLITATASPKWPVLTAFLQERMDSDRCHGGRVHVEVGFAFSHNHEVDGRATWVRCRMTLDRTQASSCNSYFIRGCGDTQTITTRLDYSFTKLACTELIS